MPQNQMTSKGMEIVEVPINDLKFAEYNPRKANEKEVADLKASLKEFGFAEPIVVNSAKGRCNVIVGGHFRTKVAKELGYKTIPCVYVNILDIQKERELNIRLNKNLGSWDYDLLANFSEEELNKVGFESEDLDKIFNLEASEDDFDAEAEYEKIKDCKVKMGDLYQLGEHRLLCGDSTKKEDVEKLMGGEKADMVFTSPPYWVGFEYEKEKDKESILNHISKSAEVLASACNGKIIINTGNINSIGVAEKITGKKQPALLIDWWRDALNKNNFLLRHIRIWAKMGGIMPSRRNDKIDMHWEYIAMFTDEQGSAGFIATFRNAKDNEGQNIGTPPWAVKGVWTDIVGKARGSGHCAAFPVELPRRYLMMYTDRGDKVYDSYGGSGTTLIACEQLNRRCFMCEIDPKYVEVIINRWTQLTNQKAKLLK